MKKKELKARVAQREEVIEADQEQIHNLALGIAEKDARIADLEIELAEARDFARMYAEWFEAAEARAEVAESRLAEVIALCDATGTTSHVDGITLLVSESEVRAAATGTDLAPET